MKTIEEAAKEYVNESWKNAGLPGDDILGEDMIFPFEAGVEFAQQWIDVKDELPKRGGSFFNDSDTVLIKIRLENGAIKVLTGHYDLDYKNWHIDADNYNEIVITHWRPIEYN